MLLNKVNNSAAVYRQ